MAEAIVWCRSKVHASVRGKFKPRTNKLHPWPRVCAARQDQKRRVGTAASHAPAGDGFFAGVSSDSWMPCHRVDSTQQPCWHWLCRWRTRDPDGPVHGAAASQSPPPATEPEYAARAAQATSTRNHNRPPPSYAYVQGSVDNLKLSHAPQTKVPYVIEHKQRTRCKSFTHINLRRHLVSQRHKWSTANSHSSSTAHIQPASRSGLTDKTNQQVVLIDLLLVLHKTQQNSTVAPFQQKIRCLSIDKITCTISLNG
jgi:hypothetical protein